MKKWILAATLCAAGAAAAQTPSYMACTGSGSSRVCSTPGSVAAMNLLPTVNVAATPYATRTAACSGSTDQTAALQAAIATAESEGGVVVLQPGWYKTSSALSVSASSVWIQGSGRAFPDNLVATGVPATQGSGIVTTSASADVLDVAGTSTGWIANDGLRDFTVSRCAAPTGSANGIFVNYTLGVQADSVMSADSIYPWHIHATGSGGAGYFDNDSAQFTSLEASGSVVGWFIDSNDGTYSPSLRIRNSGTSSPTGGVGASATGMLVQGKQMSDLMVYGFETAQLYNGVTIDYTGSGGAGTAGDIHFTNTINDGYTHDGFQIQNIPNFNSSVAILGGWEHPVNGTAGNCEIELDNSSGVSVSSETIVGSAAGTDSGVCVHTGILNTFTDNHLYGMNNIGYLFDASTNSTITGGEIIGSSSPLTIGIDLTNGSNENTISGVSLHGVGGATGINIDSTSSGNAGFETDPIASYTTALANAGNNFFEPPLPLYLKNSITYFGNTQPFMRWDGINTYLFSSSPYGAGFVQDGYAPTLEGHNSAFYAENGNTVIPGNTSYATGNSGSGGVTLSDSPNLTGSVVISGVVYPTIVGVFPTGTVSSVAILSGGSGGTNGIANINGVGGGCTTIPIVQTTTSSGVVTAATVTNIGAGCTSAPTFTPAAGTAVLSASVQTTAGTVAAGANYAVIDAYDSAGNHSQQSPEVSVTTTATGSIRYSWTPIAGAASYRLCFGTAAGAENNYTTIAGGTAYSYTQTLPASSYTAGTCPNTNNSSASVTLNGGGFDSNIGSRASWAMGSGSGTYSATTGLFTVGTAGSSITISGIPSGGRNLVISINGTVSAGDGDVNVQFNSDATAANYDCLRAGGGSGAANVNACSTIAVSGTLGVCVLGTSGGAGGGFFKVVGYSSTAPKIISGGECFESADPGVFSFAGKWLGSAAVNSLTLTMKGGGNFVAGTTVQIAVEQ